MVDDNLNSRDIYREQVDTIFGRLQIVLFADIFAGTVLFLFALMIAENYTSLAYVWYGVLLFASTTGLLTATHYQNLAKLKDNLDSRGRVLTVTALVSGIIWGTTWVIAPFSLDLEAPRGAILIIPCTMLANSAVNFSVCKRLFFYFSIPTVLLHISFLVYIGGDRNIQIVVGLSIFLVFISILAFQISDNLNLGIKLKLQNENLQTKLHLDKKKLAVMEAKSLDRVKREHSLLDAKADADNKLAAAAKEKLLLFDAVEDGIFGISSDGKINFVNSMALNLLQLSEAEVIGQDILNLINRSSSDTGKEAETKLAIAACLNESKAARRLDGIFCGKGDLVIPVHFSCKPIIKEGEFVGAVISFFDMSSLMEIETKLLLSQKMEAIGRITGGVAHDFNNLLTGILGNLQFLKRRLTKEKNVEGLTLIEKIMATTKRGADLNNRLLSFSREQVLLSIPEKLNDILTDIQDFLKRTLGEEIRFELNLTEADTMVMIDRTQFENVILNLCTNSRDAMPQGGKVTITSKRVKLAESPSLLRTTAGEGEYIELSITDTGVGIPQDILHKIFDPFFTTKETGEGSGFGLSTSFGFMEQSGGNITVESREGEWTTFTLQIPAIDEDKLQNQDGDSESAAFKQHSRTILVVDDDIGIRDIATHMLLEEGFKVITANSGRSGLAQFNSHPMVDLVFSDIIMPGDMTGIEMAEQILKDKPKTPILLVTGYTKKSLKDRIDEIGGIVCISKPYDVDKLPDLIRSMLNSEISC